MHEEEIIEKHFAKLARLLAKEEAEEILQYQEQFLKKTPEERELSGRALLNLHLTEVHFSPAGHPLMSFRYATGKPLPVYSPDIGDLVVASQSAADFEGAPAGTVYDKTKDTITVTFRGRIPDWLEEGDSIFHLNMASSRSTFRKMLEGIEAVRITKHTRAALFRDLVLGFKKPESFDPLTPEKVSFLNPNLNPWQQKATCMALAAKDVALLHGPPGTGKTTVLVEIIRQTVAREKFVFATAPSNTACDHLLECLVASGIPALRLGHPARIMEHLREHTLDFRLASHPHAKMVDTLETELHQLFRKKERHRDRRTLSYGERRELSDEIKIRKSQIRELESTIFQSCIREAPVIVGTLMSGADPIFRKRPMDLLVMDEATQAIEPASWIPILRAQKVVFAGDHFQLPPTVRSKDAEAKGLGITLFERLHEKVSSEWKSLLKIQYRMNKKIMDFSSKEFYDDQLIADDSVKAHTLADLDHVKRDKATEETFLFLDTAGQGFEEQREKGSESCYNPEEGALVVKELNKVLDLGVKPEEVAVISPYSAQVRFLTSQISKPGIEVDSVDGFQGREKEVVILSLVRSNVEGEMGFLTDTRRMNVAMTRARRKLVVVGDSATLSNIKLYSDFIRYAESIGAYRSSWEEI